MLLDRKKREEILLKTKKRTWVIYNFIKSNSTREKIISEMVNYPGTDESFYHAQYYANIDLFQRYIETQQKEEKQASLQKELDDATAVIITASHGAINQDNNLEEVTNQQSRLKKVEQLLALHNIMTVAQRMELMKDEEFFTSFERWKMKILRFFHKKM